MINSKARARSSANRASVFGTEGRGFESLRARQSAQPRFGVCAICACFAGRRVAAPLIWECWRPGRMCRSWARCLSRSATDARASSSVVPAGNSKTSDLSKGFLKRSGWACATVDCDGSGAAAGAAGGTAAATNLGVAGSGLGLTSVVSRAVLTDAMATTITNPPAMPASAARARLAEWCVLVVWVGMLGKVESVVGVCGGDSATLAARGCSSAACANRRMSAGVSIISMVSSSQSASKPVVPPPGGAFIIAPR